MSTFLAFFFGGLCGLFLALVLLQPVLRRSLKLLKEGQSLLEESVELLQEKDIVIVNLQKEVERLTVK